MRISLSCFALLLSATTFAQNPWKLNEVGLGIGTQNDRIQQMSMDWMQAYAHNMEAFQVALDGYTYTPYSEFMGTALSVNFNFAKAETGNALSHELRLGATWHTDREAMISFDKENAVEAGTYQESLIFCLVDDELVWDMAFLLRKSGKHYSIYTGVGGMLGTTFSSQLLRIRNASLRLENTEQHSTELTEVEHTTTTFAAKNAAFYRVQIPFGIEVHRKKWSFGPEFRVGVGRHTIYGGKSYLISPSTSFSLRLSYFPKR